MTRNILIIGATSSIAAACAREWAKDNTNFLLVARDARKLAVVADDLRARASGSVHTYLLDINHTEQHASMLDYCTSTLPSLDIVLIAHGTLPDQTRCEQDVHLALQEFSTNAVSTLGLLIPLAAQMQRQRSGTIAVISSVAGDRGRPGNYLYGSAKAAVSVFCEGLRGRLLRSGVHVVTIKPGMVATPMTAGLPFPALLTATPERVARDIVRGIHKRANVIYTPCMWRVIMAIIAHIPASVFKRLTL